jgi:hypothetical protein
MGNGYCGITVNTRRVKVSGDRRLGKASRVRKSVLMERKLNLVWYFLRQWKLLESLMELSRDLAHRLYRAIAQPARNGHAVGI